MKQTLVCLMTIFTMNAAYAGYFDGHEGLPGDYSVPVSAELEPFAHYPVARVCWFNSAGDAIVGYRLPRYLTGTETSMISLTGKAPAVGAFKLNGQDSQADCIRAAGQVSCTVAYRGLTIDAAKRDQLIASDFSAGAIRDGKFQVARDFETDPIGIISFEDVSLPIPDGDDRPNW